MDNRQSASSVLMVRPTNFGYDPETARSNTFQKQLNLSTKQVRQSVAREFDDVVSGLQQHGLFVLVTKDNESIPTPSAVFPNNWISTWPDGRIVLYPMTNASRRCERNMDIVDVLRHTF